MAEYSTQISQTPQVSYLTTDHLGSPRVITDQLGAVKDRKDFSAFGEESYSAQRSSNAEYSAADQLRKNYTGYEKDGESGLEFAQARYYNPKHGRFTSVDPLTASANVKNPQTFNRYSYVLNSPYKFVDPLGLLSLSTGACGQWCPGSDGGGGGGAFGAAINGGFSANQQTAEPAEAAPAHEAQHNAEQPPPVAPQNGEIPPAPSITATCNNCGNETQTKEKTKILQSILDKLIASNWPVIYGQTLTEVARNRVPQNEVTQQTATSGSEASAGTSGVDVQAGASTATTREGLKSLEAKLAGNEQYLNNNAVAVAATNGVVNNAAEFVAGANKVMINYADKLLGQADQSPSLPGSLPVRRADPSTFEINPRSQSPQLRHRIRAAQESRSIFNE